MICLGRLWRWVKQRARPGLSALDALDDPGARRDCPGAACTGAEAPEAPDKAADTGD